MVDKIYWDTNIFLTYISGSSNDPYIMAGIDEVVRNVDNNRAILVTSVITRIEILGGRISNDSIDAYMSILQRPNIDEIAVDIKIAQIAHEIRTHYSRTIGNNFLKVPDAIHLATGVYARVDVFQTLDGNSAGNNRKLLSLNGDAKLNEMKIAVPSARQASFKLQPKDEEG